MMQLINGFAVSRALYVAARLGLADQVQAGRTTFKELALATETDPATLHRLLRVLASAGVFSLQGDGRVAMTELSATLLDDAPCSLRGWAIDQLGGEHYQAWGELLHSVRTGEVAFEHVYGQNAWDHRAQNPQSAQEFDDGMASFIGVHNQAVLSAYPFGRLESLYDIGGGDGQFMAAALSACPGLSGLLFEQPHVAARAKQRLTGLGLGERCEVVEGDAFQFVPSGGSAYLLSRVIHDWDDAQAHQILAVCHRAMDHEGVLLLTERILPAQVSSDAASQALAVSDLNMLVMTGGRERTEQQYRALLDGAGFTVISVAPTPTALSVIEARPR